jgi:hypothetical protein
MLLTCAMNAQKIRYSYDATGNRIMREMPLYEKSAVDTVPRVFTEELAKRTVNIYPNPTGGQLKVEVSDFEKCKSGNFTIVNMQGQVILRKKMNSAISDLDLNNRANGVYILQINIDDENSSWKIIKK